MQGTFQVCLKDVADSKEAQGFLSNGCQPLKAAFGVEALMLRPAEAGVPPAGQTILWSAPLRVAHPATSS